MATQQARGAIQVVTSQDEWVSGEEKRKIKILQNKGRVPILENIFCSEDVKDLQILVFSIVGKTRGGKSLLLNLMIKYLELKLETEDWLSGTVSHDFGFTWKGGLDSVTRGLWIWPKIYRRKAINGTDVGILLVDSEGMFDGEATDGEIIAISGISTAISYIQMFNVKDKITTDYLETIVRNLVKGIENMDSAQSENLREDYKLMFVVRDWVYEEDHSFGLDGGKQYIDKDCVRGNKEHKTLWSEIKRTFNDMQCLLLPLPGSAVEKEFAKTGNLNVLEEQFVMEVQRFIRKIFAPEFLVPPKSKLTGEGIYRLLLSADGKVADASLSFLNMFTENANFDREAKLIATFASRLQNLDLPDIQKIKIEIETEGEEAFKGMSKPRFQKRLKKTLDQMMNSEVIQKAYQEYNECFSPSKQIKECHENWNKIVSLLYTYLCGNGVTRILAKEKCVQKISAVYYKKLSEEVYNDFKDKIKDLEKLEELIGLDDKIIREKFQKCNDFTDIVDPNVINPIWLKYHQYLKRDVTKDFLEKIEKLTGAKNLKNAREEQYKLYEAFNLLKKHGDNWDIIPKEDPTLLCKKIGYALFGIPTQVIKTGDSDDSKINTAASFLAMSLVPATIVKVALAMVSIQDLKKGTDKKELREVNTGYSVNQNKQIASIRNVIISCCTDEEIKFSYVYVTYQEDSINTAEEKTEAVSSIPAKQKIKNIPLFRIQGDGSKIVYIDTNCRVYESWADFLSTNTLPDTVICHPLHGSYDKITGFSVAFSRTPASSVTSKVLKVGDAAEKLISVGAGVTGVATLVVSAPIAAPCAIVGGAVAGIYGIGRCVMKIRDKKKHNEPYAKEVVKGVFNGIAVVAVGALRVAEGAVVVTTKVAQGMCSLNGFVDLCYSDITPELIELLNELCDISSMISFYFNAESPSQAIKEIRKAFKINEGSADVQVLLELANVNSIQYSVDKGDIINIENYVSENVTELVFILLKTISPVEKDVIILLAGMNRNFKFLKDLNDRTHKDVYPKIDSDMSKLYGNLQEENEKYYTACVKLICDENDKTLDSKVKEQFLNMFEDEDKHHLLLVLGYLMWSVSSRVRKVNQYCNNIAHQPVCLISYNVKCHPLAEVNRKIRDKIEQNQSIIDIETENSSELDDFLRQILEFLLKNAQLNWDVTQYAQCLSSITDDIIKVFDEEIRELETKVTKKENPTCNDLNGIFEEIGMKGNYGKELLQRVLSQVDQSRQVEVNPDLLTYVPACYGMADNLYWYYSSRCVTLEDLPITKKYNINNFNGKKLTDNLICYEPCLVPLPTYLFYSLTPTTNKVNRYKQGLVYEIPSGTNPNEISEGLDVLSQGLDVVSESG